LTAPGPSRLRSALIACAWFLPALLTLVRGPRHVTTCAIDGQGNAIVGGTPNGICEVPTPDTVRLALTLALLAMVVLVVRRRRRRREATGG
jgi:MYXO-CTERM domain-containing protein